MVFLFGLFCLGGLFTAIAVLSGIELEDDDFASLAQTTFVCSAEVTRTDGAECTNDVAMAQFSAGEDRQIVTYEQIPTVLIQAVVATEDKDFFAHEGVDPLGIARALYQDIRERSASQGGSTITQQYVKLTYVGNDASLVRKVREATLAIKLERELANQYDGAGAKQEILRRYLNRIYFGRGAYGVQAAAQNYFGKNVEQITLPEAAFLAGLIRSPNSADPKEDPVEAARRMNVTLILMADDGYITADDAAAASATDLAAITIAAPDRTGPVAVRGAEGSEYFVEAVRQELAELYPDGGLYTMGLKVYTTLDPALQQAAFTSVTEVVDPRVNPDDPSAALVAIDESGRVVAMMGGYDFATSQVNLATGRDGGGSGRQPGSSFKPFALAVAMEAGISGDSLFPAPSTISLPGANNGADWVVSGGGSSNGYRSLVDALRVSSNVVYAQLMVQLGPTAVVEMAERLGVSTNLDPVNALVLGSGEVSVLDMAAAYSTFADQGDRFDPVLIERIELPDGSVCWYPHDGTCGDGPERVPDLAGALDGSIARQVTYAMSQVISSGTGSNAAFGRDAAGKTGTTQDARDAWFVGYTCNLTAAVWMGYTGGPGEPVRTMENVRGIEVHGGDFPASIWSAFMTRATENAPPCELPMERNFGGQLLNPELSTTTTLPFCVVADTVPGEGDPSVDTTSEGETSATTEPCQPPPPEETTTTVEGETTETTAPGDDGTTSTTTPDTTAPTTTTTPPPESTTTSASGD
ncbi:MAG: transglycosylase domain-containing protein [Acidimicrobiales bacterium]